MKQISVAAIAVLFLVSASAFAQLTGKIETVADEGREISIGGKKLRVDDEDTAISIAGKPAKRVELKTGMQCKVATRVRMREQASGRPPAMALKIDCD